jgi:hypothetical protein
LSEQSTEEQIRDLAVAVIEALTVPYPKRPADKDEAAGLMRWRAATVRGALSCVSEGTAPQHAAAAIRSDIATFPVTYEAISIEDVEAPSLGVASLPAEWSATAVSA